MRKFIISYRSDLRRRKGMHPVNPEYVTVPFIRLSGKWLADLGFNIGESIEVECRYGELVIRKLNNE